MPVEVLSCTFLTSHDDHSCNIRVVTFRGLLNQVINSREGHFTKGRLYRSIFVGFKTSRTLPQILNALILLGCDVGEFQTKRSTNEEMVRVLKISTRKIDRVKKRFVEEGLEIALNGRKGSRVYVKKADGDFEAHLVAVSCSDPPEGFARWSLRLLANKVVELDYIDGVSHETVRRILKKRNQALAAKRMANSTSAKQQLCCKYGNGAGC